jgi:hypothetical protein
MQILINHKIDIILLKHISMYCFIPFVYILDFEHLVQHLEQEYIIQQNYKNYFHVFLIIRIELKLNILFGISLKIKTYDFFLI